MQDGVFVAPNVPGFTNAYTPVPPRDTVDVSTPIPRAARGMDMRGMGLSSAVVGDPQVPGKPNPELVTGQNLHVVPMNKLSGSMRMMAGRMPHMAEGTGGYYDGHGNWVPDVSEPEPTPIQYGSDSIAQPIPAPDSSYYGAHSPTQPSPILPSQPAPIPQTTVPAQLSSAPQVVSAPAQAVPPASTTPSVHDRDFTAEPLGSSPALSSASVQPQSTPLPTMWPGGPGAITDTPATVAAGGGLTTYPDEVLRALPVLQYLQSQRSRPMFNQLSTASVPGAFGSSIPEAGAYNARQIYEIMQDPTAAAMLSSLFRSAQRDMASEFTRNLFRAPKGNALSMSSILT